ncbi:MAG: hypothetical protein ACK5L1_04325, partial [Pseudanabaena sp.]
FCKDALFLSVAIAFKRFSGFLCIGVADSDLGVLIIFSRKFSEYPDLCEIASSFSSDSNGANGLGCKFRDVGFTKDEAFVDLSLVCPISS